MLHTHTHTHWQSRWKIEIPTNIHLIRKSAPNNNRITGLVKMAQQHSINDDGRWLIYWLVADCEWSHLVDEAMVTDTYWLIMAKMR